VHLPRAPALGLVLLAAACGADVELGSLDQPLIACRVRSLHEPTSDFFVDISGSSGIQKDNFVVAPPRPIPINDHSRVTVADLDGDGRDDIVASSLFPNALQGVPFDHLVFLNRGDRTFREASEESGLRHVQAAYFVFGDVDNDGDQDCFAGLDITLPGETSALYLNDGHGHFTRKVGSGLEAAALSANALFGDFDGDGILDLYSGNGSSTAAVADQLFFGRGDGTFFEVSERLENRPAQPTNGTVACDYDGDGDLDIFVSHYGVSIGRGWRTLWENDGHGHFTNVAEARRFHALPTGNSFLATTDFGRAIQPGPSSEWIGANGFGIDCQDIDGDGVLDIWQASISHPVDADFSRKWSDPSQVFLGSGAAGGFAFRPVGLDRGLPFNEGEIDAAAADFDNDGRIDLSVTRDKKYEGAYTEYDQKGWFGLHRQRADSTFEAVARQSGINANEGGNRGKAGQSLAWLDLDGDGDLDLVVGGRDNGDGGRANWLFENRIGQDNGWLGVRLHGDGRRINRDAIGARVTLTIGEKKLVREVKSSRGTYASADTRALVFGLGAAGCTQGRSNVALEVRWPNGDVKRLPAGSFPLDQYLDIDF
jgi:enediyne biosynthesis protein E4